MTEPPREDPTGLCCGPVHRAPILAAPVPDRRRLPRLLAVAALLACRAESPTPPRPPEPAPAPPAADPCDAAPVPQDSAQALARVDVLLRCDDERGALDLRLELLRRDPTSTARAHALAELAHATGRVDAIAGSVAALPLTPLARAVHDLTRDVLADLDAPDPDRGAALVRQVAATLALADDDVYALALALRFTAAHDADPGERAAPLCHERAERKLVTPPDRTGAAVLAAACGQIAFMAAAPGDGRRRLARALELDPGLHAAALAWAAAELAVGNTREAARLYALAVDSPRARTRYAALIGLGVARTRLRDRAGAEQAYRDAARLRGVDLRPVPPDRLPPELVFNLGTLLADADDPGSRAEARALLRAYEALPGADPRRRLRARQLLHELELGQ